MNRTEVIVGSAIAALAIAGLGQLYLDKGALRDTPQPKPDEVAAQTQAVAPRQTPEETKPITADEVVAGFMTSLEQGTQDQKVESLASLLDQLESPTYQKAVLYKDTAEPFAQAAVAAVTVSTSAETPELAELRGRLAYLLAARTHGPTSKQFVLDQLVNGTPEIKAQIARGLGRVGGVHGGDVFDAVAKAGAQNAIPGEILPGALRRLGGKKAVEPIVAAMKASSDWKTIDACVVALQDGDPSVLGPSFERLEQLGLLEKSEKLPWISAKLFGSYMQTADGSALQRGLRVAAVRPSLLKVSLDAAKKGLDAGDAETRRLAAQAVRKAVLVKLLSPQDGESLLAGRLGHETEPVLKAELTGGLEQVRGLMPKAPEGQQ